jgi:hypothetical protein
MRTRALPSSLLLLCLPSCAGTGSAPDPAAPGPATFQGCRDLVQAPPSQWHERLPIVLALGAPAAPALVEAIAAEPTAPGAQAAVAALGQLGGDGTSTFLRQLLADRSELATEAALALGALGDQDARAPLLAAANDRLADPTLRAACAASLLRLGVRAEIAPLVRAILLAGTPPGQPAQQALGLPDRPRWAHERYLIQRALRDVRGDDFGLDTDAPWPALEATAAQVDAFLTGQQG